MGIMKKQTNLTLPEWAFLDGTSHLGNTLEGRDILQHIRSYTMMEIFPADVMEVHLGKDVKVRSFSYNNIAGEIEKHLIAVHFSLAEFADLDEVLDKAVKFYTDYLKWEDENILDEYTSKHN